MGLGIIPELEGTVVVVVVPVEDGGGRTPLLLGSSDTFDSVESLFGIGGADALTSTPLPVPVLSLSLNCV